MCCWATPRLTFAVTRCLPFSFRSESIWPSWTFARLYASIACERFESISRIWSTIACACARFELIDGSAVADPVQTTRATARLAIAAMTRDV